MEERALRDAESLGVQQGDLERRLHTLEDRERNLATQAEELKQAKRVQRRELERISALSASQARQLLLADIEQEARHQAGVRLREIEEETKREAERRARDILSVAMQRLAAQHAGETTSRLVDLPSDEMKGRIIGRDGRNIRALEKVTGVDVIIDETPNAVVLSSFDGVRREVARVTLERLIADGRIHPALIEETYEQARTQVEERIAEEGERAALDARVHGLDPELVRLLGQLRFRTSYGQNVLEHLVECANLAAMIAEELGASVETARRAALLHDIGKAVTHEVEGPHALVGAGSRAATASRRRWPTRWRRTTTRWSRARWRPSSCRRRTPSRGRARVRAGTRWSSTSSACATWRRSPPATTGWTACTRCGPGRELRVIVDPGAVDDDRAALISHEIATAIEKEVEHRGGSRSP